MNATVKRWAPVIAYAALITGLSSIPARDLPPGGFQNSDKVAHVLLYSGAGFVVQHALGNVPLAVLAVSAYGALDEQYQRLIPGRNCDASDWIADSIGGIVGALVYPWYEKRRRR